MKPTLFIICGHIGVRKTTTAKTLCKILNIQKTTTDELIAKLFSNPSNKGQDLPFNDSELEVCYNVHALIAEYILSSGKSIVADGVFAKKE